MGGDTQNWLRFYNCRKEVQYKEDFMNSYYFAKVLANLQKDQIQIPESVLIEELLEDEKYIYDNATTSKIIKEYVIRLLQKVDTQKRITERNYESELRKYFDQKGYLPQDAVNPLQKETTFHSLSSKAKLWIMVQLMRKAEHFDDPTKIAEDSHGNVYTLVDGGRLYVGYGKELWMAMSDSSEKRTAHRSPFEQYLAKHEPGKLLAETEWQWKQIIAVYDSYGEDELASKLRENIDKAKSMMVLCIDQKEQIREEFIKRMQPQKKISTQEKNNEEDEEGLPSYQDTVIGKKKAVCFNWPECPYGTGCHNHHPVLECTNFQKSLKCPGWKCRFIHPVCPNDGHCTPLDCAYRHFESVPTLRRRWNAGLRGQNNAHEERSRETTGNSQDNRRRTQSRGPSRGTHRSQSRGNRSERASSPPPPPPPTNIPPRANCPPPLPHPHSPPPTSPPPPRQEASAGNGEHERSRAQSSVASENGATSGQKNLLARTTRCGFWPGCKKPKDVCQWAHPENDCAEFLLGNCSMGRLCPNLHGKCANDGTCGNIVHCPYDHYEQRVPLPSRRN